MKPGMVQTSGFGRSIQFWVLALSYEPGRRARTGRIDNLALYDTGKSTGGTCELNAPKAPISY